MASELIIQIVAEDLNEYLVLAENIDGEQKALWLTEFAVPVSLAAQWKTTRAKSTKLLEVYKRDQTTMDAFGPAFVNIYFQSNVIHAVMVKPASIAWWNALTSKHPGCEMIRAPTKIDEAKIDEAARDDYLNRLRDVAHQATSPLSDCGHFEGSFPVFTISLSPSLSANLHDTDMLDAEADQLQVSDAALDCQDLPFVHNDPPSVVFKCEMPEHGDNEFHRCTSCSADAILTLTVKQQDAYNFGAIFPLCKDCGLTDVNDDIFQRLLHLSHSRGQV